PPDVRLWQRGQSTAIVDATESASRTEGSRAGTVSADLLRHPLPSKARDLLLKAHLASSAGDHARAVSYLEQALRKYPDSAAWIQSLLGVEYVKTDQFPAAVSSLEQAVKLLPRDAVNRSNLGLSLAAVGQYDRAETELRRAL